MLNFTHKGKVAWKVILAFSYLPPGHILLRSRLNFQVWTLIWRFRLNIQLGIWSLTRVLLKQEIILAKAKKWKFRAFFDPRLLRTTFYPRRTTQNQNSNIVSFHSLARRVVWYAERATTKIVCDWLEDTRPFWDPVTVKQAYFASPLENQIVMPLKLYILITKRDIQLGRLYKV